MLKQKINIVLVHGAYRGGWVWKKVKPELCRLQYHVFAPTLSGLGERVQQVSKDINLTSHIQDVVAIVETFDLQQVVLVGHSYAGLVVAGAGSRLVDKLLGVIYLDAVVPKDNDSFQSILKDICDMDVSESVFDSGQGKGWLVPHNGAVIPELDNNELNTFLDKLTPQSLATLTERVKVNEDFNDVRKAYIACRNCHLDLIVRQGEKVKHEDKYIYKSIKAGHDPMISHPQAVAEVIDEVISEWIYNVNARVSSF